MLQCPRGVPRASIGWVRSPLVDLAAAPRQGDEGAPDAELVFADEFVAGLGASRPATLLI